MEEIYEDVEIVIVGAGLAGLTTALGLHRLGVRSLVLESSESLRITGFALALWTNAWKALDAVGVGHSLREKSIQIQGIKIASPHSGLFTIEQPFNRDGNFNEYEIRCMKRKDLLETLVNELPVGTIRYSSKVSCIDESDNFKLVRLVNGSILKTKVLIGCDGVNSIVAKWLGLATPVSVDRSAIRGLVEFPDGLGFDPMLHGNFGGGIRFGFVPIDDKTVYWFCTFTTSELPSCYKDLEEKPIKMKQFVSSQINKMSQQVKDIVEQTPLTSISCAPLKLRLPWNILFGDIVKDNVCVAGDALHPMTSDIGQGGSSALEDAIVLARCLGEAFQSKSIMCFNKEDDAFKRINIGLEKYGKERRWRSISLVSTAYLMGFIQENKGILISYFRKVWFSKHTPNVFLKMASFDCGKLVLESKK